MERPQIIVTVAVLAALGLFGLKIWSDQAVDPGLSGLGGTADDVALARRSGAFGTDGSGSSAMGAGGGGRLDRAPGSHRLDAGGAGANSAGRRGGGSATALRGAEGQRGGIVGRSGSTRASSLPSQTTSRGSLTDSEGSGLGPRIQERSNLVDFLGAQEPTRNEFFGVEDIGNPEEDVVLEVNAPEDTEDQAIDAQNVERPNDGVGIELGEDSVLAFPNAGNANGDAGSISFELEPQWTGSDQTDNSFVQIRTPNGWENRMQLVKNGRYLRFILTDNTGREADISYPIDNFDPGEPHTITATYGDGQTALYVDGQRVGQNTYSGEFQIPPNTPMYVGSDLPGGTYNGAGATIQNFKVYGRALDQDEAAFR